MGDKEEPCVDPRPTNRGEGKGTRRGRAGGPDGGSFSQLPESYTLALKVLPGKQPIGDRDENAQKKRNRC